MKTISGRIILSYISKINITDSSGFNEYNISDEDAQAALISTITLNGGATSLTKTNNTVDIPASSSKQDGVMTALQAIQLNNLSTKFEIFHISGKTDTYGKIGWSNKKYYPIMALTRNFAIAGDQNGLRVLNVQASNVVLATNVSVDFYVIGMKFDYS